LDAEVPVRKPRAANHALRALLAETGLTGAELARAVNAAGRESGVDIHYQRASASQWLDGMRPRPPVPDLICEVLSRRLGRRVGPVDAGFAPGAESAPSHDATATDLWRCNAGDLLTEDVDKVLRTYSLSALDLPGFGERSLVRQPGRIHEQGRCHSRDVTAAESMLDVFSRMDAAFGGGSGRRALVRYLRQVIAPLLRFPASSAVRRSMLMTAARLTCLCAHMHFDDMLNGYSQYYYRLSLRLSDEAADAVSFAVALRGLSVQSGALGHYQTSERLASEAVRVGWKLAPLHVRAFLAGQLAVAAASLGSHDDAAGHMHRAKAALQYAAERPGFVATFHAGSLECQCALVAAARGDIATAIGAFESSLRHRPNAERRSRALTLAHMGEMHLACGHLEAACTAWHRFLDDYPHLSSRRADTAFTSMRAFARSHQRHWMAAALADRAAAVQANASGFQAKRLRAGPVFSCAV
jgi:tetratricopeptide (TPR) repeat protein